ncbi:MAG: hypothetical protein HPAVJP_0430 [Candidatus Hepatoplasma vulgare]|nr:MAG: hypothetical protein HPAVJP_0430 [Candidatus Hepatoplasma sp.]
MIYLVKKFNDLNSKKNEDYFSDIFIDKDILKNINEFFEIDNWKRKNIKALIGFLKSNNIEKNIFFYYKKWNSNIDLFYNEIIPKIEEYKYKSNIEVIKFLKEKKFLNAYSIFKNLEEEEKFGTLIEIIKIYDYFSFLKEIDEAINNNYLSLIQIYNSLIFKIFGEK